MRTVAADDDVIRPIVAVNIVKQLQTSILMLDEVDMILHPLKSELNWPLGKRKPLDYGASRWAVPFHLIDALFYCTDRQMPEAWKTNGTAQALLTRLEGVVSLGLEGVFAERYQRSLAGARTATRRRRAPATCCCCATSRSACACSSCCARRTRGRARSRGASGASPTRPTSKSRARWSWQASAHPSAWACT